MAKRKHLESKADSASSSEAVRESSYTLTDSGMPTPLSPGDPRRSGVPKTRYHPADLNDSLTPEQIAQLDPNYLPWGL